MIANDGPCGDTASKSDRDSAVRQAPLSLDSSSGVRWPLFIAGFMIMFAVYSETWLSVLERWFSDPTYSHGFLVAAASAWLVYRVWALGRLEATRMSSFGIPFLVTAGLVWFLGTAATIEVIRQLALPALLLGFAGVLFGRRGFTALFVPIAMLYLIFPAWDYLRPLLQDVTTIVVGAFLHSVAIPAAIHDNYVELPAGSFVVAEGCSGLHFFMAATAMAVIQGHLFLARTSSRAMLLAASVTVALVANWVRVGAVVVAGHVTDMQHFLLNDHYYFGWVVFLVLMIPVVLIGHRFASETVTRSPPTWSLSSKSLSSGLALTGVGLMVVPALIWTSLTSSASEPVPSELPRDLGGWQFSLNASPDWETGTRSADRTLSAQYHRDNTVVDVRVFYYARQLAGKELVGFDNPIEGLAGDSTIRTSSQGELRLDTGLSEPRLVKFQYVVAGVPTTSSKEAKLLQLAGVLRGNPSAYLMVASSVCSSSDCLQTGVVTDELMSDLKQSLDKKNSP